MGRQSNESVLPTRKIIRGSWHILTFLSKCFACNLTFIDQETALDWVPFLTRISVFFLEACLLTKELSMTGSFSEYAASNSDSRLPYILFWISNLLRSAALQT